MISVLDTGLANSGSVINSIRRLGYSAQLTQDPDTLIKSPRVILPGVGSALALMDWIHASELKDCLKNLTQPVLGICLGMQILYASSAEGDVSCLGIFPGRICRIQSEVNLPIPHMGWNQVLSISPCKLLRGIPENSYFYFVHSFRAPQGDETKAICQYGEQIPAVIEAGSWFGTQFHPERSGTMGEMIIRNFLDL